MASVPHPVPSRLAHNVAALYGHEDDTLITWQRFCAQAAEALRTQHDPERLSKALALTQGGHVALEDTGYALVTSGTKRYQVQADGTCDCPDYQHRGVPCKHVLAVLIHARAQELVAPSPSPVPPAAAASAPAPTKAMRQAKPRHSAAWDVHEAPVSSCFKIRITRYQKSRYWALWDGNELVAVVLYKKGATELLRRLAAQPPAATEAAAQAAAVEAAAQQAKELAAQACALARQAQAAARAARARAQPACEAGAAGG
jgi:hypothetical protein